MVVEVNAIMDNIDELIGESQTGSEGTEMAESMAFFLRFRERESVSESDSDGKSNNCEGEGKGKTSGIRKPVGNGTRTSSASNVVEGVKTFLRECVDIHGIFATGRLRWCGTASFWAAPFAVAVIVQDQVVSQRPFFSAVEQESGLQVERQSFC